jgi:galactose-1-phosphate uridylyltransferase
LFFDNEGHPAFVEWDMPSLGETQHEGLFFHQPVVQRDSIDRIGTVTLVSGRREKRPQAKLRQPDDFISAGFRCDFCDQKKVAGPQTEYGEMSPEEWLNQGPFIAGYLNPLEYHDSLKVFSGTNLFAVMQYHKVVLPDRHPRSHSILDLSPAMLIALYHGTHATMRTILENFPDQGIDQVIAGHNFGTSENPFPSGATIKHPHTQVGAINTYIPHISNALGRRVRRYNARGIDFLEGYLTALRQAGLVFYEDRHVAMYVPFAPLFKDEIQVMAKRREAGNPLMLTPQEEGHINFSIALSILGLARFKAPGADGRFVSTGVKSFNTFYMGRRTTEKEGNEGLRMLWTITPRQAHLGLAELQGHYIVSRNPKESAQLMQRALNNLMLPLLVKGEYAKTEGETELLADFITRRPDFARLYQLDAPAQVEAARLLLREIYPLI